MKPDLRRERIRRIVIGIDSSRASLEAMQCAVLLAAEFNAEIEGIFVEDIHLIDFARLPFARLTSTVTCHSSPVNSSDVERIIHAQAQKARQALAQLGESYGVNFQFRIARGDVEKELISAAESADLLSIGSTGIASAQKKRSGSFAKRVVGQSRSVLILREAPLRGAIVTLIPTIDERSDAVVQIAAALAKAYQRPLVVVTIDSDENARYSSEHLEYLRRHWQISLRHVAAAFTGSHATLAEALREAQGGVLVLDENLTAITSTQFIDLMEQLNCGLLVLRSVENVKRLKKNPRTTKSKSLSR